MSNDKNYPTRKTYLGSSVLEWILYMSLVLGIDASMKMLTGQGMEFITYTILFVLSKLLINEVIRQWFPHYSKEVLLPNVFESNHRLPREVRD